MFINFCARQSAAVILLLLAATVQADVYVADNPNHGVLPPTITVYATTASGNTAPIRTISGNATTLNYVENLTIDNTNNELYVADFFGEQIVVFPLNANGNVAPTRVLAGLATTIGQPRVVGLDLVNNEIFVGSLNGTITVFPRTASGNVAPTRTIAGAATLLGDPFDLFVDTTHNELITVSQSAGGANVPGVLTFPRGASGNVAPTRNLVGANTQLGTFVGFLSYDAVNDEIYVQAASGTGYAVFPRTANGNVAPSRLVMGAATGLVSTEGMVYDPVTQRVIVSDTSGTASLRVFRRTDNGNVSPQLVVAGPATLLAGEIRGVAVDAAGGFTATQVVTTATAIPTLSPFAVLSLALLMGAAGIYASRRRKRQTR
jgi:hypothetical protein